ncbi:hypothetical protein LHFGNBLO_002857 [Mesorhizobium sp. AR10]|uniref:hypothetical protein n=1 Tax=Mesorhizobium sp. AR10 TaxID=2865839 RepID=UPI00215E4198|nr:hypothetical protein [Mesorhizobium sp. AR10]UVK41275.1 hypothetical protein LHFGNBLO_002857 [Mesorhizobium sp. AR10]
MPRNFDEVLAIDADGRIAPRGPLSQTVGEQITKLYAWVLQMNPEGSGAACVAVQADLTELTRPEWVTRSDAIHEGRFREGPAFGTAMTISKELVNGKTKVYCWSETIYLKPEKP